MNLRKFLRMMIPVCALAVVSCTNEELVLDASQTQRGREFAQAFKARFGEIDPNHTWVDGSVGKVTVTTDQPANIVIYGLGRTDGTLLRLKRCVVNGTQEVKYDIPAGCQKVVLRAYNANGNEYKTLEPSNENDEAVVALGASTRAATLNGVTAQASSMIDNVWNIYGSMAPYQTDIPSCVEPIRTDDWNFYYQFGTTKYNMYSNVNNQKLFKDFVPFVDLGSVDEFLSQTRLLASDQITSNKSDGYWQLVKIETKQENGYSYYTATVLDDENAQSGTEVMRNAIGDGNYYELTTTTLDGQTVRLLDGLYFNFKPFGKRGSWWIQQGQGFGHFFVTSMDLKNVNSGTLVNNNYYKIAYNTDVISQLTNYGGTGIMDKAEDEPDELKEFNTDAGFTTVADGPVTISYIQMKAHPSSTISYIGYYYTVGEETDAKLNAAPRYVLMANGNYTDGDTFPLTYYGEDGNGTPDFDFPADVNIHFFIVHGRDSGTNDVHPHSGYNSWTAKGQGNWLFYDETYGWTLDAWYLAYSQGGVVNEAPINRIYDSKVNPDPYIQTLFNGNYRPTVAFNYAGYNIIGFEDTPVKEWATKTSALDWNDCVFILNGNFDIKKYKEEDLAFSMCMEDLGGTDDLDYNDLFMIVTQAYEEISINNAAPEAYYSAPKVIIPMAGGTLPLKVRFAPDADSPFQHMDQTLFEDVHKAFRPGLTDVAINTFIPSEYNNGTFTGSYNDGDIVTVNFRDGAVVKCVKGLAPVTTVFNAEQFTKDDIADFSILDNINYFKVYVTYDNGEEVCISGPRNLQVGEDTSDEQKTPFAFWFPQTVESESQSTDENRTTPGHERQFLGEFLNGFNQWVADQSASEKTSWYNWKWGTNDKWEPGSGSGSQGGEGGDTPGGDTPTSQFVQVTEYGALGTGYTIPASYFTNATTKATVRLTWATAGYTWTTLVQDNNTGSNTKEITGDDLVNAKNSGLTFYWYDATPPIKVEVKCE